MQKWNKIRGNEFLYISRAKKKLLMEKSYKIKNTLFENWWFE